MTASANKVETGRKATFLLSAFQFLLFLPAFFFSVRFCAILRAFARFCASGPNLPFRRYKAFLGIFRRWTRMIPPRINAFSRELTRINLTCGARISANLSPRAAVRISAFQLFTISAFVTTPQLKFLATAFFAGGYRVGFIRG